MKTIKDHLGHIILSVAAVALIVGVVLAFAAPVGNFFDSIIEKTNEQAQGNIWDQGNYTPGDSNTPTGSIIVNVSSENAEAGSAAFTSPDTGTMAILDAEGEVTVEASANAGYIFTGWYKDDQLVSTDNPYTFNASESQNVVAKFEEEPEITGPVALEPGAYTSGTIQLALDGDASASTRMVKTWDELIAAGYFVINGTTITGGDGMGTIEWGPNGDEGWEVVFPQGIQTYNVDNADMQSCVVPYGVTALNDFTRVSYSRNCVVLPNTITYIGHGVFDLGDATIYYCGTEDEWNAININEFAFGEDNEYTIIYNCAYPNSCAPEA